MFCIYLFPFPQLKLLLFFPFSLQISSTCYPLSTAPSSAESHFSFLFSVTASVCILTSEDLELAITDEKEHVMFVFLGLAYLSQYECYCFLLYPSVAQALLKLISPLPQPPQFLDCRCPSLYLVRKLSKHMGKLILDTPENIRYACQNNS